MSDSGPLSNLPGAGARRSVTSMLLRFVSCGILCLVAGFLWWLRAPSARVSVVGAIGDMLVLLGGFIVGGILWYIRDIRVRKRSPGQVAEERIVFSFIVFVLIPLAVLALVAVIWVVALFVAG